MKADVDNKALRADVFRLMNRHRHTGAGGGRFVAVSDGEVTLVVSRHEWLNWELADKVETLGGSIQRARLRNGKVAVPLT